MKEGEKIHGEETGQKEERPLEENAGNEEVQTSDFEKLEEQLAQLENEKKALEDKYLRVYSEFENYRKRVSRDQNDYSKFATEKLLKELLVVADNLERALQHSDATTDFKDWVKGVDLTFKQFSEILSKSGVTTIQSVGFPFDPNRQQAMAQVETETHEENTVVEEYQKGYMLHNRVLRPALVTVAKKKVPGSKEEEPQE